MKATYDRRTDSLTMIVRDAPVIESKQNQSGVIIDFDNEGHNVAIEILDASRRVGDPSSVTVAATA